MEYNRIITERLKYLEEIKKIDPDFAFPIIESNNPESSFAKLDEKGFVQETAEKNPISKKMHM